MQDHEVREALQASLADGRFDRTERYHLRDWLEASAFNAQKRAMYQSMAFALTAAALDKGSMNHHSALNWLERVVKTLTPLTAPAAAASVTDVCFSPQHDCAARIVQLFDQARQCVDVCVFTITDDRITSAIERAHRRGLRLRILTDNDKLFDPGSDISRLTRAGISVRTDNTEYHMHHKFSVFDSNLLLNGSYNWTRSASLHNEENFVISNDAKLVQPFRDLFEQLWAGFELPPRGRPAPTA
jgi:phosphatidylserine/phosphatidylglycerophosphate/cardiolipin synthase-like enzyme